MIPYQVRKIRYDKTIRQFIASNHYTQTSPSQVKICFGMFDGDVLIGVITISNFSRLQSQFRYYGCLELSRMYIKDDTPKNTESWFLGHALREMKKDPLVYGIVSYADTTEGHQGTVYLAANFKKIGETRPSYHYSNSEGKRVHKKQVWARSRISGIKESEQAVLERLTKVDEKPKNVFLYQFKELPTVFTNKPVVTEDGQDFVSIQIGQFIFKIDKDDLERVLQHRWTAGPTKYAHTRFEEDSRKIVSLHRFINNTPRGFICDHINNDRLDNRKCNLRAVSSSLNNANKIPKKKYRGVRFHKGAWNAAVNFQRKHYHLGRFDTPEEAARAYDKKLVEIYGSDAPTNFDISEYEIPSEILAKNIPQKILRRKARKKCLICGEKESAGSGFCQKHLAAYLKREITSKEYEPRVKCKAEHCTQIGCDKPVFARNLCQSHYREWRIFKGIQKRTKEKNVYLCKEKDCNARVYRASLCKKHWREAFGVQKKKVGRPKQDLGICVLCDQPVQCSSLCKNHYQNFLYRKAKDKSLTVDDFISSFSSFKKTTGKEGRLGEQYIRLEPNGRYMVMIKRVRYGTFKTLSEAIEKRDEALQTLTSS